MTKKERALKICELLKTVYPEAICQLKKFLIERGNWMDRNIDAIREFSAESAVKKYNENAD